MKKNKLPSGLSIAHFVSVKPIDVKPNGDGLYEGTFDTGQTTRFYALSIDQNTKEEGNPNGNQK